MIPWIQFRKKVHKYLFEIVLVVPVESAGEGGRPEALRRHRGRHLEVPQVVVVGGVLQHIDVVGGRQREGSRRRAAHRRGGRHRVVQHAHHPLVQKIVPPGHVHLGIVVRTRHRLPHQIGLAVGLDDGRLEIGGVRSDVHFDPVHFSAPVTRSVYNHTLGEGRGWLDFCHRLRIINLIEFFNEFFVCIKF